LSVTQTQLPNDSILDDMHYYIVDLLCVRMFLIGSQVAGPIRIKRSKWIHLDPGSEVVKSGSRSEAFVAAKTAVCY